MASLTKIMHSAGDSADAGDDTGAGHQVVVDLVGGQLGQLRKGEPGSSTAFSRSRGSSLPRAVALPGPWRRRPGGPGRPAARRSSTWACMVSRLALKAASGVDA